MSAVPEESPASGTSVSEPRDTGRLARPLADTPPPPVSAGARWPRVPVDSRPRRAHPLGHVLASTLLRSAHRLTALGRALLAVCLLTGAPAVARAQEKEQEPARPADAPVREDPVDATPLQGTGGRDEPSGHARLPGMSAVPPPQAASHRLSAAGWVAHGGIALLPVGTVWSASRVGEERFWRTSVETGAGMLTGLLPSKLLFLRVSPGGRVTEFEVAAFTVGLLLTPPLTALGTWGTGEWAFHGSRDRGDAFLGALGGAAAGALVGVALYELLDKVAGDSEQLASVRQWVGLGFIGAGSTLGYQWAGGGPRMRHAR